MATIPASQFVKLPAAVQKQMKKNKMAPSDDEIQEALEAAGEEPEEEEEEEEEEEPKPRKAPARPAKGKRGRPVGSRNKKPKAETKTETETETEPTSNVQTSSSDDVAASFVMFRKLAEASGVKITVEFNGR